MSKQDKDTLVNSDQEILDENVEPADEYVIGVEPPEVFAPRMVDPDELQPPFYKTQAVADRLGLTRQTVLNLARIFEEFLSIKLTESGERRYTEDAIAQLAYICSDKVAHKRNNIQELEYLRSVYSKGFLPASQNPMESIQRMFNEMRDSILEQNKEALHKVMDEHALTLEDKNSDIKRIMELYEDLNSRYDRQEKAFSAALSHNADEIDRLRAQLADKNAEIESLKAKKKGFFRFGK